jgi:hypothetical protein
MQTHLLLLLPFFPYCLATVPYVERTDKPNQQTKNYSGQGHLKHPPDNISSWLQLLICLVRRRRCVWCLCLSWAPSKDATGLAPWRFPLMRWPWTGHCRVRTATVLDKPRSAWGLLLSSPWQPSPPTKLTDQHQRTFKDTSVWEKTYLHLFRFIYIHSWILIQKEKIRIWQMFTNKIPSNRFCSF